MKIIYDQETDSLTLLFREGQAHISEEPRPGVILDFDARNRLMACEILDASSVMESPGAPPEFERRVIRAKDNVEIS